MDPNAKIRLQDTDERIQMCGTKVSADCQPRQARIGDDELTPVVAVELRHDISQRVVVKHEHLGLPGEFPDNGDLRQIREDYTVSTRDGCLAGAKLQYRFPGFGRR